MDMMAVASSCLFWLSYSTVRLLLREIIFGELPECRHWRLV